MIRKCLPVLAVVAGLILTAPGPFQAQAQEQLTGLYDCEGMSPDGTRYRGTVEIAKHDDTYRLRWKIAAGSNSLGIGIMQGDVLAVSYFNGRMTGIVLYKIEKGSRLVGEWTGLGAEGKVYPETLTRAGLQANVPADAVEGSLQLALADSLPRP